MNQWNDIQPTEEQKSLVAVAKIALCEELNALGKEGVPPVCALTALGMVIADLITTQVGPQAVAPWHDAQAAMIRELQADSGKAN